MQKFSTVPETFSGIVGAAWFYACWRWPLPFNICTFHFSYLFPEEHFV